MAGLWYLTFGGGTPQTGLTKQLYFVAGPSLGVNTGQGLFGRIIAAGEDPAAPGRSALGAAAIAGPVSTMPLQLIVPLPVIESVSQSADPQGTSVAGQPSILQPPVSDLSSSVTQEKNQEAKFKFQFGSRNLVLGIAPPALDSLIVGVANGENDLLWEFRL
jgi:hypothetical protein